MLIREIRRRFTKLLAPVASVCSVGYFSYHLVQGNHGLRAYWRLGGELSQAQKKIDALKKRQDYLEHRVALLKPGSICPDLLDEQVRSTLGYADPHELVVIHSKSS